MIRSGQVGPRCPFVLELLVQCIAYQLEVHSVDHDGKTVLADAARNGDVRMLCGAHW